MINKGIHDVPIVLTRYVGKHKNSVMRYPLEGKTASRVANRHAKTDNVVP